MAIQEVIPIISESMKHAMNGRFFEVKNKPTFRQHESQQSSNRQFNFKKNFNNTICSYLTRFHADNNNFNSFFS